MREERLDAGLALRSTDRHGAASKWLGAFFSTILHWRKSYHLLLLLLLLYLATTSSCRDCLLLLAKWRIVVAVCRLDKIGLIQLQRDGEQGVSSMFSMINSHEYFQMFLQSIDDAFARPLEMMKSSVSYKGNGCAGTRSLWLKGYQLLDEKK